MTKTFQQLWSQWAWRPLRNCPGRFVMPWTEHAISFEMLLDNPCAPQVFSSPHTNDPVLVVELEDGGIISYQQADGRIIHTLNTPEGFSRKLQQLKITVAKTHAPTPQPSHDSPIH